MSGSGTELDCHFGPFNLSFLRVCHSVLAKISLLTASPHGADDPTEMPAHRVRGSRRPNLGREASQRTATALDHFLKLMSRQPEASARARRRFPGTRSRATPRRAARAMPGYP